MRATTTTMADANTVLNVNPTVCMLAKNAYAQPHNAPTPTTPQQGSKHMQAQENNHKPPPKRRKP